MFAARVAPDSAVSAQPRASREGPFEMNSGTARLTLCARAARLQLRVCRCRRLNHLPHAVLGPPKERVRRHQQATLQDCRDEHLQDRQARPRKSPYGRHRYLHRQEARRFVPIYPQHGCPQCLSTRIPACKQRSPQTTRTRCTNALA